MDILPKPEWPLPPDAPSPTRVPNMGPGSDHTAVKCSDEGKAEHCKCAGDRRRVPQVEVGEGRRVFQAEGRASARS